MKASLGVYRAVSFAFAVVFVVVGLLFLIAPDGTLSLFNLFARRLGLAEASGGDNRFFAGLAVAYMAVVTALAWSMYRRPDERIYPRLLVLAKTASSLVSFGLFFLHKPLLISLANGVVDGGLALFVWLLARSRRRQA